MLKHCLCCLLLASLTSAVWADHLYVRNKRFSGYLTGSVNKLSSLEVDINEFSRALGYSLEEVDGNWVMRAKPSDPLPSLTSQAKKLYVLGQEVRYRSEAEHKLVHLAELAVALNGRLVHHPEVGTIDFNLLPRSSDVGFDAKKFHLIFYGASWAPASKLFRPVIIEFDLRGIIPVIYVDCTQPRSPNYKNFIRYFNGDKIPYTVLVSPAGRVIKTWTGYQDIGPFTTEIQKLTDKKL